MSPLYILSAFNKGADGVLVSGCHPGDCHYIEGQLPRAAPASTWCKKLLEFIGVEQDRFRMSWVSAAEGAKYRRGRSRISSRTSRPLGPQSKLKAKRS